MRDTLNLSIIGLPDLRPPTEIRGPESSSYNMDIETFPEIEDFQHLPRQVIVKGGAADFSDAAGASLQGIVINNIGNPIRNVRVHVVVFNEKKIPIRSTSTSVKPEIIPQGGIGNFSFQLKDFNEQIKDYYLYTDWNFHD